VKRAPAPAKLNLALVVGPRTAGGKHRVTTVLQRIDLFDRIALQPAPELQIRGFGKDTLVREALELLAEEGRVTPSWEVELSKRVPVAAGLGGGSSDAATALRLANETLQPPLPTERLRALAARLGADVPFFLQPGPQLGEGDGSELRALELPQDFWVVLLLPRGVHKLSTAAVYEAFDRRGGEQGYEERRRELLEALGRIRRARDLGALPANDLATSPLAAELIAAGAFRADVSGAGPAVYGLFASRRHAERARSAVGRHGETWLTVPAWYG